ncbi:hypothetical protein MP638_005226 [Amoeboaphelidium occidentale]|nr:hypothetical protein MP638_005226 [Amoeboaphelidium occidentale]
MSTFHPEPSKYVETRRCPGTQQFGDCFYPGTPVDRSSSSVTWLCPSGYFCISPNRLQQCPPGFFCPGNTSQPIYCPAKYNCSYDTTLITRCPEGFVCPIATTSPLQCMLSSCPEGTEYITRFLVFPVVIAIVVIYIIATVACRKFHIYRLSSYLRECGNDFETDEGDIVEGSQQTFTIEFQNLSYQLPKGETVLSGLDGRLESGNFYAILGPSGCGKSTLVSILLGKLKGYDGTVLVNDSINTMSTYKKLCGFVPQDDVMLRELTVGEVLLHSARSRLPASLSELKKVRIVKETMDFLSLTPVYNSYIGDEFKRGISGGQRKRVNIGIEVVSRPSVLFLDEPTSGLDTSTAYDICCMLKELCHVKNLLIVAIIHSPTQKILDQFDAAFVLGQDGRFVYSGHPKDALSTLKRKGFIPSENESISEFLLDVAQGKATKASK